MLFREIIAVYLRTIRNTSNHVFTVLLGVLLRSEKKNTIYVQVTFVLVPLTSCQRLTPYPNIFKIPYGRLQPQVAGQFQFSAILTHNKLTLPYMPHVINL
jgi:hypothetical protein